MRDPHDTATLDLVEAARQPLSAAERQRRHRQKRRREREEGSRAMLDLPAKDLALVRVAVQEFRERWKKIESKARAADSLLPRLPKVQIAEAFPGDSAWIADAAMVDVAYGERERKWPDHLAHNTYFTDILKEDAPGAYRQTPYGQLEVDGLVKPGDLVKGSYCAYVYQVKKVILHIWRGLRCFTLECETTKGTSRPSNAWFNSLVAVDGRLLQLFANNNDEVFLIRPAAAQLVAERISPLGGGDDLQEAEGLREFRLSDSDLAFLLWCIDDHMTIRNDLEHLYVPSVRDLIDRLFKDSRWSACIDTMGNNVGIQNIIKRYKEEASRAHRNYQDEFKARSKDGERYTQSLRSLERENSMVVAERTQAFEAVAVLQRRLREAGLSDDYRA